MGTRRLDTAKGNPGVSLIVETLELADVKITVGHEGSCGGFSETYSALADTGRDRLRSGQPRAVSRAGRRARTALEYRDVEGGSRRAAGECCTLNSVWGARKDLKAELLCKGEFVEIVSTATCAGS